MQAEGQRSRVQPGSASNRAFESCILGELFGKRVGIVGLEALLETSEIVTLDVPLPSASRRMVNQDRLERMNPSTILINTTGGAAVDEVALVEALQERGFPLNSRGATGAIQNLS